MRLLLSAYRDLVQLRSIATSQRTVAASNWGRRISGACSMKSQVKALRGMPGAAQGEA